MSAAVEAWASAERAPGTWITATGGAEVRVDADGTRWRISRFNSAGWMTLTCQYRDIRLRSQHPSPSVARRHVDDIRASWQARTMRDYTGSRP